MGPLRDDDVGALIQYLARLPQTLHLTDCDNARPMNRRQKWSGIAKRQHDRCRSVADRLIEGFGPMRERPSDKPASDPGVSCRCELALQAVRIAVGAPNHSQPVGTAHHRGELAARALPIDASRMGRSIPNCLVSAVRKAILLLLRGIAIIIHTPPKILDDRVEGSAVAYVR
jgi:hypothetical protein